MLWKYLLYITTTSFKHKTDVVAYYSVEVSGVATRTRVMVIIGIHMMPDTVM